MEWPGPIVVVTAVLLDAGWRTFSMVLVVTASPPWLSIDSWRAEDYQREAEKRVAAQLSDGVLQTSTKRLRNKVVTAVIDNRWQSRRPALLSQTLDNASTWYL
jgi:uncharacterized membrane protein